MDDLRIRTTFAAVAVLALLTGCGKPSPSAATQNTPSPRELHLLWWSDSMAPDTVTTFTQTTGVKVQTSTFDTSEVLEARMLTGHSGFDAVNLSDQSLGRLIRSGALQPLDKALLPNLAHQDPALMAQAAVQDPGNRYGLIYGWGSIGIIFNKKKVAIALPGVALDSWRVLFDPGFAAKLASCGISFMDSPPTVVRIALLYLGKNMDAPTTADLAAAEELLRKVRPYIRTIDTGNIIDVMANGDSCVALDYNGDAIQAGNRARETGNGVELGYTVPGEGSSLWMTMASIPRDAPNPTEAHRFLNYLMEPAVSARFTAFIGFATANTGARPVLNDRASDDAIAFPSAEERKRLRPETADDPERTRVITRLWQKFKTGQ